MSKTITFIFPHPVSGPTGGYKVVYEYANRLVAEGHKVNIVYSGSLFCSKKSLYFKLTNCFRYIQMLFNGYGCRKWFNLDKRVKEHLTFSLNYRHVPKESRINYLHIQIFRNGNSAHSYRFGYYSLVRPNLVQIKAV